MRAQTESARFARAANVSAFLANNPVNRTDPLGLASQSEIDQMVTGSLTLDDCLAGCDRFRQTDLRPVRTAATVHTAITVGGGIVTGAGALLIWQGLGMWKAVGIVTVGIGAAITIGEFISDPHAKAERRVMDSFGRCCNQCGERHHDTMTAMDHFSRTYPDWQNRR